MSILENILNGGYNQPQRKTISGKLCCFLGRYLALRNKNVKIGQETLISPSALINPREGAIEIGNKSIVASGAQIQGNVRIGENSSVQARTIIVGYGKDNEAGLIRIGNGVRIAANCMFIAANHVFSDPETPIYKQGVKGESITIDDDVWIAGRVNIMAGVTIGKGSIIGAGAVVTKDIPPMSIAAGVPAKILKQR